ncbi:hypothetical protein LIER_19794 [Lithospermum erythrorhizon]|uniref:Uncharacterized protein n=1 Tax=Lithospermum erythrorhizon TaxID=34254 RepID=A0AAV3QMT7_LITER
MNKIGTKLGMLSLLSFSAIYMMTAVPKPTTAHCSNLGCDPSIPFPNACEYGYEYGCHCLDYGDGNRCQAYHEAKGIRCLSHDDCSFRTTKDVAGYCYRIFDAEDGICSARPIKS